MTGDAGAAAPQRHFLALCPDARARAQLQQLPVPEGARRVHPADLHVTLAFLGSLDPDGEAGALQVGATVRGGPLTVRLERLEYWAGPAILCAAAGPGGDPVAPFARALAPVLAQAGFPAADKAFRAHVTLARKVPPGAGASTELPQSISWLSAELALLASLGGDAVPRYVERGRVALWS